MTIKKPSRIFIMHYVKLFFRSALFITALVIYIINRVNNTGELFGGYEKRNDILTVILTVFLIEMALRFFPSRIESMGCQKQFARNYRPTGKNIEGIRASTRGVAATVIAWVTLNGAIGALYFAHIIDRGILLLISLAYSVCDMICILFFCPFQTWFMKNRCCTTCRIYNWDFAMMFTPLIFINNFYSWCLVIPSLLLLLRWEITAHRKPERFCEQTNACLSCAECEEKLCHHKKQLLHLWKHK